MRPDRTTQPPPASHALRDDFLGLLIGAVVVLSLLLAGVAPAQSETQKEAHHKYLDATRLQRSGRLAEAHRVLLQAHALAWEDRQISIALGKLDSILGQKTTAVELFRQIQSEHQDNAEDATNLGVALADNGSLYEALPFATQAVTLDPHSSTAHHLRGKILAELDRPSEAQADYEAALAIEPANYQTLYDFALLCNSMGKGSEEIALLRRLIKLRPASGDLHLRLGRALAAAGDESEPLTEAREAVRLDPDNRAALYILSRLLRQKNPAEAARYSARFKALRLSDEEMNTLRDQGNRGVRAMQARDWPQAISIFRASLIVCAGCTLEATLEKDLGLALCQSGDTSAGAESLRRSLALNPNDLDVLKALDLATRSISRHEN